MVSSYENKCRIGTHTTQTKTKKTSSKLLLLPRSEFIWWLEMHLPLHQFHRPHTTHSIAPESGARNTIVARYCFINIEPIPNEMNELILASEFISVV